MRLTKMCDKNETHKKTTKIKLTKNPQKCDSQKLPPKMRPQKYTKIEIHKNDSQNYDPLKCFTKIILKKSTIMRLKRKNPQKWDWQKISKIWPTKIIYKNDSKKFHKNVTHKNYPKQWDSKRFTKMILTKNPQK